MSIPNLRRDLVARRRPEQLFDATPGRHTRDVPATMPPVTGHPIISALPGA